jgi:methionyl-tRNA formyltransferase
MSSNDIKFVFWGSSDFSVYVLEKLKILELLPNLVISTPDMPVGRKQILTPTPAKVWANANNIAVLTPDKIKGNFVDELKDFSANTVSLVASYGKIIPNDIINLPEYGTLNIHPSLLPKYRGPSPLQEQILNDEQEVGVSIMIIDEQVDHGPIVIQEKCLIPNWPVSFNLLEKITAIAGADMFYKILPDWNNKKIVAKEQKHSDATFTKKVLKEDGEISLAPENAYKNYLKYLAYSSWPGVYFFADKDGEKIRVLIKTATFENGNFIPNTVLPAGKKEMSYADFLRGLK